MTHDRADPLERGRLFGFPHESRLVAIVRIGSEGLLYDCTSYDRAPRDLSIKKGLGVVTYYSLAG